MAHVKKWFPNEGDYVTEGQTVIEILIDDEPVRLPSPVSGFLVKIAANERDDIQIMAKLGVFCIGVVRKLDG